MSKRVVQSVIVFATAIISYLLYSAAVKDDEKAAPVEERGEPQESSAVAEDAEADTPPVIKKVKEQTTAKSLEPTVPTFIETTPKAAVVQKSKIKKQDEEPEIAVETIEPVVEKAASVIVKSIDDNEKKEPEKSSPAKAVRVEESPPVFTDDKVEEASEPVPAVVVQAKVSKEAVKPVPKVEKVPVPAVVAPKTVIIQEPETVKQEIEKETVAAAVKQEAEKDITSVVPVAIKEEETVVTETLLAVEPDTSVEVVPAVETAAAVPEAEVAEKIEIIEQEKEPEAVAVVTEPVAEKVTPAVAAPVIETEKVVSVEESLPVVVEEKADTVIEEQKGDKADLLTVDETPVALAAVEQEVEKDVAAVVQVAIKEEPSAAVKVVPVVETAAVLADTPEVEVADKTEEIKEEEPQAVEAVAEPVLKAETVPVSVMITPKAVSIQEAETAAAAVEQEVEKDVAAVVQVAIKEEEETVAAEASLEVEADASVEDMPTAETVSSSAVSAQEEVVVETPEETKQEKEPQAVAVVEPEKEVVTELSLEEEPEALVEDVPMVETTAVLAVTPEVEVADETEEIKEEEPQAVEAVAEPVAETVSLAAAAPTTEIEEVVSIEESLPVALAAVAVQAEVSKKAADVLTEETVATSAIVTPKTVPVQETEALKHEAEPEIVVTVVEPEAEKDLEAEAVTVVPVVETAAVLAVTTESVAVATVPAAENTTPAVATPIIETAKVVSMEESLPVVVEEKVDTSVLEQQRSETEELIPVETKEDVEAAAAVETTLALVATEEAEVTDKSEKTEQEKEPEAVVAVTVSAAEQVVTVEESLPVMKEEKLEAQEKTEVVEELEADVVPVVVEAEETVIAESSVLASAAVVQETAEIEKPETIEEEKEPKTVEAVIEQEPEKNLPVVKPIDDSREEKPKPRTQEDEKKAQKTYKNYGNKAAVVTPEAEEEEMLLHQRIGYFIRDRDGVDGLGRLQETKMLITLGAESEQSMYGVSLEMVQLESGKLKITDQPLYGTDGTVAVETPAKSASGLALSLDYRYEQKNFAVSGMIGMTPSAGNDISPVPLWDVAVEGNFDILKTYGRFVQRAVVDSLLSSVGNSDLYTQQVWGRVVKQGVEAGVRLGEEYKFAWNLGYYPVIKGKNTLENSEITTTVSAVKSVAIASIDRFDAGLLLAYDDYEFDSEHYTYGHGGYFSPQSYMRGELLFDMTQQFSDSILFDARASVGYTSYKNEAVEKYPFEAGIETYAADSSKFISAETAVFLGLALGDSAQMMTGAGYSNSTGTNEYFLSFAFHIYLQEHQMSRKDFMSIDRFANTSR